jgi:hypothetical protein
MESSQIEFNGPIVNQKKRIDMAGGGGTHQFRFFVFSGTRVAAKLRLQDIPDDNLLQHFCTHYINHRKGSGMNLPESSVMTVSFY